MSESLKSGSLHIPKHAVLPFEKGMNYCLNIPRFPQTYNQSEWPQGRRFEDGGAGYWGDRSCGLASLRMIIAHFGLPLPSLYELLEEGLETGAHCPDGWIHKKLAKLGKRYGLKGKAIAISSGEHLQKILERKGPVIVSVTQNLPVDGRRGGHLVVVSSRHNDNEPMITFRDPSSWGETHSTVTEERFFSSFTGRGIVFTLKKKKSSLLEGQADRRVMSRG